LCRDFKTLKKDEEPVRRLVEFEKGDLPSDITDSDITRSMEQSPS
jgi:hypothetical protein